MRKLLDIIWPRPMPETQLNPSVIFDQYTASLANLVFPLAEDSLYARLLDISRYLYDDQERKWQTALTRANPTMTTAGLGLALFGGMASLLGQQWATGAVPLKVDIALTAAMLVSLVYLVGGLLVGLQVYGYWGRSALDANDLVPLARTENTYIVDVSKRLMEYATENMKVHNLAVARVICSQERLRNGFFLLAVVAVAVLGLHLVNRLSSSGSGTGWGLFPW